MIADPNSTPTNTVEGAATKPRALPMWVTVLPLIILSVMVVVAWSRYTPDSTPQAAVSLPKAVAPPALPAWLDAASNGADVSLTAVELASSFHGNEVAAEMKYAGVRGLVTGQVLQIENEGLILAGPYTYERVTCLFTLDQREKVATLSTGAVVTVMGTIRNGRPMSAANLSLCRIVHVN